MLQSLELFGFKSFADRVKFDFDPGITCVVGPNGSGKSNVVDAIKWLLGDQSAKSLRGSEMSDVIFNGSAARAGSGYAEAILTFNNESGLIPYATREVAIGRRLYRSGESEYLLNGDAVRLKDIRSLFLGTGAGSAAYSIIEQGRVGQILQANPAARRVVFEEAAGVSKFKARRVEAERRLSRIATNLERLSDIVDETETRLAATRSQASKAAKYRELTRLLREQWLGLAGDRYRRLNERIQTLIEQETQSGSDARRLATDLSVLEERAEELSAELATSERELSLSEAEAAHSRETLAGLRSTLRAKQSQAAETEEEIHRLMAEVWTERALVQERSREIERVEGSTEALESECAQIERDIAVAKLSVSTFDEERARAEAEVESHNVIVERCTLELNERLSETRSHESRLELLDREFQKLIGQRNEAQADVRRTMDVVDEKRAAVAEFDRAQAVVRDRIDDLRSRDASIKAHIDSTVDSLATAREEKTAAEARLAVLRDLEPSSGQAVSARELLDRARESTEAPWSSIVGRVGELIDCDVEHAPLIDLALGPRAHLIAARELDQLVDYLNSSRIDLEGRVGFIELDGARVLPTHGRGDDADSFFHSLSEFYDGDASADLSETPGVITRLDTLVRNHETLAARVLGDTWLVENLAIARNLQRQHPHARFLTRAGELIDSDGSAHFGQLPLHVALVGRRTEVRELRAHVARFRRAISDGEQRLIALQDSRQQVRTELRAEESRQPDTAALAGQSQSGLVTEIDRLESYRLRVESIQAELHALENERTALIEKEDAAAAQMASASAELAQSQSQLTALEETIYTLSRERAASEERVREFLLRKASLDARYTSESQRLERLRLDISDTNGRLNRLGEHLATLREKESNARLAILNMRAARDETMLAYEAQNGLANDLRLARERIRAVYSDVRSRLAKVDAEARRAIASQSDAEMKLRETRADLQRLEERCEEDFSLTAAEAAETPSAYDAFCNNLPDGVERPSFDEVADSLEQEAQRTRRKIKTLGSVNTESLRDLDELETRFEFLSAQLNDLNRAKATLEEIIERTNSESRRIFSETFETVRGHFQELFRKCFGGGSADIVLEDAEDVLDAGIDILARPPGKELRNLSLLSGGEKAMTAVALLMALFRAKPSPYCILDEVDAPLDEANIDRFLNVVREFRAETQFVVITHRRRTMTAADVIYGVTMETSGVSKRLAVNLDEVADDGSVKVAA